MEDEEAEMAAAEAATAAAKRPDFFIKREIDFPSEFWGRGF